MFILILFFFFVSVETSLNGIDRSMKILHHQRHLLIVPKFLPIAKMLNDSMAAMKKSKTNRTNMRSIQMNPKEPAIRRMKSPPKQMKSPPQLQTMRIKLFDANDSMTFSNYEDFER